MNTALATEFLNTIFAHAPRDQWLSVFALDRTAGPRVPGASKVLWGRVGEVGELVGLLEPLAPSHCIWFGVATRKERLQSGRGGAEDCALIPGLWADIDIRGPGHRSEQLPPTEVAALELLAAFPEPSLVVRTGGGLQPYWLLDEPLSVADAKPRLDSWAYMWTKRAGTLGWAIDPVWDVARVLRLAGSFNLKLGPDKPVPVTLWEGDRP